MHSLTTCTGELGGKEVGVTVMDDGRSATAPVTTDENAETCLTTMQLSA